MSFIDAHAHGPENLVTFEQARLMVKRLIEEMDKCGFDMTFLACMGRPPYEYPTLDQLREANGQCRHWAELYPSRIRSWAVINPQLGKSCLEYFTALIESGDFIGIKLWKSCRVSEEAFFHSQRSVSS